MGPLHSGKAADLPSPCWTLAGTRLQALCPLYPSWLQVAPGLLKHSRLCLGCSWQQEKFWLPQAMYLYQNIPCSCGCLPSKQAKQKRGNLSDEMKRCHSKPFILGTPKAGSTKPSIHFSTCLHNTLSAGSKSHTERGLQSTEVAQSLGGPRTSASNWK